MIAFWHKELSVAWEKLARSDLGRREYRTVRLSSALTLDIHAAIRAADGAPCLILEMSVPVQAFFEVGGMRMMPLASDGRDSVLLVLEDFNQRALFITLCADIIAASDGDSSETALARLLERLEAWRAFLRERRSGLSRSEITGLFGELIILRRLISIEPRLAETWQAPVDGLHDFVNAGHALEIKSSLGTATRIGVSGLDQLDTSGLARLDIVQIRMAETREGESIGEIITDIEAGLPDQASRHAFLSALIRRGLEPGDEARNRPRVHVVSARAFTVGEGFPRLTRQDVSVAIREVTYWIESSALEPYEQDLSSTLKLFSEAAIP